MPLKDVSLLLYQWIWACNRTTISLDTISLPNYTGSVGYGEKYIQELIGKCGTLDVADCIATVQELINLGLSEEKRQVIHGGSHGGFLTAHRKSRLHVHSTSNQGSLVQNRQSSASILTYSARLSYATPSSRLASSAHPTSLTGPFASLGWDLGPVRMLPQRVSPRYMQLRRSHMWST